MAGPSDALIAEAEAFFACPSSGAQMKDMVKYLGVLIAAQDSGGIAEVVKISQVDPNNVVKLGGGVTRTPTASVKTVDFTVTAGKKSVAFIFADDFVGTVLGAAVVGPSQPWIFNAENPDVLDAIAMTRSAGSVTIIVIP